jgi:hypothetical protein
MSTIEERIREALEKSRAYERPEEFVGVVLYARIGPSGLLEITQPTVRTPWIPVKSKS